MDEKEYERLHNYTKYKLVEMLINKYKDKKLQSLNAMDELAEDVLEVLDDVGNNYVDRQYRVTEREYNYE